MSGGPILALLIFAALGLVAINMAKAIITAAGKPGWTFILTGPLVPLALIGHLILIPWLGGVGASIVTASGACLGALASVFAVYRIWGILPPVKTLLKSGLCTAIAFALASLWQTAGFMVIVKLATILFVLLIAFLLLGDFTSGEIALARTMLGSKLKFEGNNV